VRPAPPTGARRGSLLVFAAMSLKEALDAAVEGFESLHPGRAVTRSHAGSGLLVRQIELGAPADLFLSASPLEIDRLQRRRSIREESRTTFASNRLVVVVARGIEPPRRFADLGAARFNRIAVGNPRTVPAGLYAGQALRAVGIQDLVKPRLIIAEDVRQVLQYVARGEVDAGLVYRTEALHAGDGVVIGPEAPAGAHDPILYQGAIPAGAPHPEDARAFLDFLRGAEGQSILARFGFLPPPPQ
jgi:molybdate transport system substrate-binding protein